MARRTCEEGIVGCHGLYCVSLWVKVDNIQIQRGMCWIGCYRLHWSELLCKSWIGLALDSPVHENTFRWTQVGKRTVLLRVGYLMIPPPRSLNHQTQWFSHFFVWRHTKISIITTAHLSLPLFSFFCLGSFIFFEDCSKAVQCEVAYINQNDTLFAISHPELEEVTIYVRSIMQICIVSKFSRHSKEIMVAHSLRITDLTNDWFWVWGVATVKPLPLSVTATITLKFWKLWKPKSLIPLQLTQQFSASNGKKIANITQ